MGTIKHGANGGFSGKAGSVIGSSWKSINYIKGLYKKRTKPASEEQLMQQARFQLITGFLFPLKAFLRVGFGLINSTTTTALNVALRLNINRAVIGQYPDYALDYSMITLSRGGLFTAGSEAVLLDGDMLIFSWDHQRNDLSGHDDDRVYIVAYHPQSGHFLTTPTIAQRSDGETVITLPAHIRQGELHCWMFLAERNNREVSSTIYLGQQELG